MKSCSAFRRRRFTFTGLKKTTNHPSRYVTMDLNNIPSYFFLSVEKRVDHGKLNEKIQKTIKQEAWTGHLVHVVIPDSMFDGIISYMYHCIPYQRLKSGTRPPIGIYLHSETVSSARMPGTQSFLHLHLIEYWRHPR